MALLYPGDPGYEAAIQRLLAKAQALNPAFRLATPEERERLDPRDLYSFSKNGRPIAPTFVLTTVCGPA